MPTVQLFVLLVAAVCCLVTPPANAIYHIVGGSLGWSIPPNKTYYEDWAKQRVFGINDKLFFQYSSMHNVVEVEEDDFESCTQKKVIKTYPVGPLIVNFTQPGDHYYYSGVGKQCELSQKLHVAVVVAGECSTGRILPPASGITGGH